jgi:hypothetical protein
VHYCSNKEQRKRMDALLHHCEMALVNEGEIDVHDLLVKRYPPLLSLLFVSLSCHNHMI